MKYLKQKDGTPLVANLHQRGLQGPMDMVIPNSGEAEARFEMFNKQPAGYLYHVLPMFGETETFIKSLLQWLMDAGLATEAPRCTYNAAMQILTTPRNAQQESVLSDVSSFYSSRTLMPSNGPPVAGRKGRRSTQPLKCVFNSAVLEVYKRYTAPSLMCAPFHSSRTLMPSNGQLMAGRKGRRSTQPLKCVFNSAALKAYKRYTAPTMGNTLMWPSQVLNWAWVLRPPQSIIQMPSSRPLRLILLMTTPPPTKRARRGVTTCPPLMKHPHPPLVMRKNNPMDWPAADSPLRGPPLCHGGGIANRDGKCQV
jgi:hypothetical protein